MKLLTKAEFDKLTKKESGILYYSLASDNESLLYLVKSLLKKAKLDKEKDKSLIATCNYLIQKYKD